GPKESDSVRVDVIVSLGYQRVMVAPRAPSFAMSPRPRSPTLFVSRDFRRGRYAVRAELWRASDRADPSLERPGGFTVSLELEVNGKRASVDVDPTTPLLWVLREELGLIGTMFGCGAAQCGACTVHVDGAARRSCVTPLAD